MVAALVVSVEAYRIEVRQLSGIPDMVVIRECSNEIATNEDVEDTCDEGDLLSCRHVLRV